MAAGPHLTVQEKILLHLLFRIKYEDRFEVPYAITQGGIAEAVRVRRSYVSSATKEMIRKDLVFEKLSHVTGEARRRKVYFLTPEGKARAERLRDEVTACKVIVKGEESREETTVGELVESLDSHLSILDVIAAVSQEGVFDITAGQTPAREPGMDFSQSLPSPRYFFGRERELVEIRSWLESGEGRILTIKGMAGVGKTTLVARVARDAEKTRKIFWYGFHHWSTQRNLLSHLSDFLARTGREALRLYLDENKTIDTGEVQSLLVSQLADLPVLLIFDDVHRAGEPVIHLFEALLAVSGELPDIRMVLAGRTIPRFYDRRDVLLRKRVHELELGGLDRDSSRQLLRARQVDEDDMDAIYEDTMGHPLSLELVELSDEGVGKRNIEQYLAEEVLARLTGPQKHLLRFASVFRYPVPPEAYLMIPGDVGDVTHETIDELVERALISVTGSHYHVHDLLKDFFYRRMGSEKRRVYHGTVAEYFGDMAGDLSVIEAMFHRVKAGDGKQALRLALQHGEHLVSRGYLEEFDDVLTMLPKGDLSPGDLARVLVMEADMATTRGRWDDALTKYGEALAEAQKEGDDGGIARAQYKIAAIYYRKGELDEALALNNTSLELLEGTDEGTELSELYNNLGVIFWKKGSFDEARTNYESSLAIAEGMEDMRGVARALNNLGILHWERKKIGEAIDFFSRSLDISLELEDRKTTAILYDNLGESYWAQGDRDRALEFYEKSLALSKKLGFSWQIAEVYRNLGKVYEGDESRRYLKKAHEMFTRLGARKDAEELKKRMET